MIQENLYLFEVYINKCIISVGQQGDLTLFMRIGKTISSFLKAKSYDKESIIFQSSLRCNCQQNALQTQRFSLTLNMKNSQKENKVLGIVMIPLQGQCQNQLQTYKISQSLDTEATIQLKYSITLINAINNFSNKDRGKNSILTPKKPITNKKLKQNFLVSSSKSLQSNKQKSSFIQTLLVTPSINKLPSSQFIQEVSTIKKYQLQKQKQMQITKLKQNIQNLSKQNIIFQRQKLFLKQMLKIETKKNNLLSSFLQKIYKILTEKTFAQILNYKQKIIQQNIQKLKQSVDSLDKINTQAYFSIKSRVQNSSIKQIQEIQQKQRNELIKSEKNILSDSKISLSKISNISEQLSQLLKDSIIKQKQESKKTISQLKKALMDESSLKSQRKLRSVKLKIQKSYIELFKQGEPYNKQQLVKHKIGVNKILDQLIMCTISQ